MLSQLAGSIQHVDWERHGLFRCDALQRYVCDAHQSKIFRSAHVIDSQNDFLVASRRFQSGAAAKIAGVFPYFGQPTVTVWPRSWRALGLGRGRLTGETTMAKVLDELERVCKPLSLGVRPDPLALADRDRRANLEPRDLTAWFFGDPLPGMSALNRRLLS